MTATRRISWLIVAASTLFSITGSAQESCAGAAEKYRDLPFGDVRFAIEESCPRALTQNEQLFVAGIAQSLSTKCRLRRDRKARTLVERFTNVSKLALSLRKADDPGAEAYAAGTAMMEDIPCDGPEAALLSRGIVRYLQRTAGSSRFVAGCVELYAGRYNEQQCRCIAEKVRPVVADVHQRFFDRELIRQSIHESPFTAFPLMLSCGVGHY